VNVDRNAEEEVETMKGQRVGYTNEQAAAVAGEIGLNLAEAPFDIDQFRRGMEVELEHGVRDPETNVTNDDPMITGKIAWAHLREFPDYYDRLAMMEAEAEEER
jgi:hypothetical protein